MKIYETVWKHIEIYQKKKKKHVENMKIYRNMWKIYGKYENLQKYI